MKSPVVIVRNSSPELRHRRRGFTLIELMIVLVIVAIGVALAVPTYENIVQKRSLTSAAEQIAAFLALAQGEAVKRNRVVAVSIKRDSGGTPWCVGAMIKTAADDHCDCEKDSYDEDDVDDQDDLDYCDFNTDAADAEQLVNAFGFDGITMSDSGDRQGTQGTDDDDFYFNFDPVRGTKLTDGGTVDGTDSEITLESSNTNFSLRVGISVTGRVRVCNPDATKAVPGFEPCV